MQIICALIFILTLCPSLVLMLDCGVTGDGVFDKGCKSFIKCVNGSEIGVECPQHEVFNPITLRCDHPKNVIPPCGHIIDCSTRKDGHYPDLDQRCQTYYTCNGGTFFGHTFCPGVLVFNTEIGVCDWPTNVYSPCGLLPFIPPTQIPTTTTLKPTTTVRPNKPTSTAVKAAPKPTATKSKLTTATTPTAPATTTTPLTPITPTPKPATPIPTTVVETSNTVSRDPPSKLLNNVAFIDTLAGDKLLKNILSIKD